MDRSLSVVKNNARLGGRNLDHNNRQLGHEKHIDAKLMRDNILYFKTPGGALKESTGVNIDVDYYKVSKANYERKTINNIFGSKVSQYNQGQRDKGRRINDFYEHVSNKGSAKKSMKTSLDRELIIGIGSKEDFIGLSDSEIKAEIELRKAVLHEFMTEFEERFPNFKITQGHMHCDERLMDTVLGREHLTNVNPHLHIDCVPFMNDEYNSKSKKLKKPTINHDKALMDMYPNAVNGKEAFEEFLEDARSVLDAKLLARDKSYKRKEPGTHKSMDINEFKAVKDAVANTQEMARALQTGRELLAVERDDFEKERETFEKERATWKVEKEKDAIWNRNKNMAFSNKLKRLNNILDVIDVPPAMKNAYVEFIETGVTDYKENGVNVTSNELLERIKTHKDTFERKGGNVKQIDKNIEDLEL